MVYYGCFVKEMYGNELQFREGVGGSFSLNKKFIRFDVYNVLLCERGCCNTRPIVRVDMADNRPTPLLLQLLSSGIRGNCPRMYWARSLNNALCIHFYLYVLLLHVHIFRQ